MRGRLLLSILPVTATIGSRPPRSWELRMQTLARVESVSADQRFVIHNVSWRLYETLLDQLGDHAPRMTYDRGNLELMSPSPSHESFKKLLGRLIETLTCELGIAIRSGGSTTFKRKDLLRGLEPDECYWVAHEP